tara:strand:- start:392 stop:1255 length:864 start_codon:yes stop_codon:yes gene_type:complete
MLIRAIKSEDLNNITDWYKSFDDETAFMQNIPKSLKLNIGWSKNVLQSNRNIILIGEYDNKKIGLCKFTLNDTGDSAHVSVKISPEKFTQILYENLLIGAIKKYLVSNNVELFSYVEPDDDYGIKFFESVGFVVENIESNQTRLKYIKNKLRFREVALSDSEILYNLLKKRRHGISHQRMPSFDDHNKFLRSDPYLHWFLIIGEYPIGTFYIQSNNSIGLNFLKVKNEWVSQVINFINSDFQPCKGILSKIPPYFYLNTAANDEDMIKSLSALGMSSIQVSYKINKS